MPKLQVLRRIVEAAVVLVDADCGALGVIGQQQKLAQFIPVGVSDAVWSAIGDLSSGRTACSSVHGGPRADSRAYD
jgi:hypothetical protein